jgi:hypothetical protein
MRSCHRHRSQGHDGETAKRDVINCCDICHFHIAKLTQQFLFPYVTVRVAQDLLVYRRGRRRELVCGLSVMAWVNGSAAIPER